MKIPILAILAAVGMAARAQTVTVYIRFDGGDSDLKPLMAQDIASRMFGTAGVRISWRADWPRPKQEEPPIVIDLTSNTPRTLCPGALAYAHVFEGIHIQIFWDRVRENADGHPLLTNKLLAHVMVHEITHILQGLKRHSAEGVMKAHWTSSDIMNMGWKPLPFGPEDIELIHRGLANRAATVQKVWAAAKADSRTLPKL
jgi:hypothetical protein